MPLPHPSTPKRGKEPQIWVAKLRLLMPLLPPGKPPCRYPLFGRLRPAAAAHLGPGTAALPAGSRLLRRTMPRWRILRHLGEDVDSPRRFSSCRYVICGRERPTESGARSAGVAEPTPPLSLLGRETAGRLGFCPSTPVRLAAGDPILRVGVSRSIRQIDVSSGRSRGHNPRSGRTTPCLGSRRRRRRCGGMRTAEAGR